LAALKAGGAPARKVESLSKEALAGCRLLVVGELCLDGAVASAKDAVLDVARRGGRVVILAQMGEGARGRKRGALGRSVFSPDRAPKDLPLPNWAALPLKGGIMAGSWTSDYVQIDPRWALLKGLEAQDFREWNEMDRVVCESGLSPHPDIAPIATTGNYQRETALGLMPLGQGQVVLCQLILARRAAHDPIAAEMLLRLLSGNRIEVPPVLTVETEAPVEARAGETIKVTTRIANKGDADAEADVYTLDARSLPTGHQRVKVSAGQTTTTVVSSSRAKPWLFSSPTVVIAMGPRPMLSSGAPIVVLGPGEVVRSFDFGSPDSPVAKGYTQVTYQMRYPDKRGYGWRYDNGLNWRNRSGPNDLFRDFEHSSQDNTFSVDLPNGEYTCVALIGDQDFPLHPIEVKAEGKIVVDGLKSRAAQYHAEAFQAQVSDGVLDLDFHNRDAGQNWEIAGLVILKR
jgi:hypothetical protein